MILKPHKPKHQVTLFASLRDYFAYRCRNVKKESRCCVNDAVLQAKPASVWVITRNRFGISMSLDEVSTDRLFPLLTNIHYDRSRRLLRLLVLVRSRRLTCSGAVRAGKNAAARCSISCRRAGRGAEGLEGFPMHRGPPPGC